ncbi:phage tail tape measure protein [Gemmata sp.]|uniref:phage tail tape measure protein n=1 Tax=Gemmata sp. TaxID=1914242 RepID=UPI003F727FEA
MASVNAIKAGEAYVQLTADDAPALAALKRFEGRFRATFRAVNQINDGLRQIGGAAVLAGAALTPVVATYLNFDDAIRAVGARTEATADQFDRLRASAMALGRTSGYTATEVAKLMNVLGTAGFNPDQVIAMAPAVLNLARAGDADPAIAAQGMADALNTFKLPAEAATAIADKFAVAANKSAINLAGLAETFQYVAPVANQFGMSLDKALALSAALGNLGIRGSEAGTALRRMQVLLGANEADLNRLFGVTGRDAAGELRPVIDVIGDIQASMAGLSGGQKIEKLNEFFGLLGITSAAGLGSATVNVKDLEAALADAGGTAERTAAQMDAGIGGAWRRMRGAAESAAISVGEVLAPALSAAAAGVQWVANRATEWIGENRGLAATIGAVVVGLIALGAAGLVIVGVVKLFFLAAVAVKALVAAVGLLLNPLTWVAILAGVLIEKWLRTSEVGRAVAAEIGAAFSRMMETVGAAVDGILAAFKVGSLRGAWEIALLAMEALWHDFVSGLLAPWHHFTNLFRDAWRALMEWVLVAWQKTQAFLETKLLVFIEAMIVPALKASDLLRITSGKADEMQRDINARKEQIEQNKNEAVAGIVRELEAAKNRTMTEQAATRKAEADKAVPLRERIREITERLSIDAAAIDALSGGVGGAAKLAASPELGGRVAASIAGRSEQLGDAVKGAYQAADFSQAFGGMAPGNNYGKQQVDRLDKAVGLLEEIRDTNGLFAT